MTRLTRQGIVIAVVVVATAPACHKQATEEVESETVVTVKTAVAGTGDIRGIVHATGVVNPAPGAELVVVAPEAARIAEVPHAVGDRVRRGDVLVRFEIPSSTAEVQRQQAELARAHATLDAAKAAQARATELFEKGVAARREVEDATRTVAEGQASVAEAEASLAAARTVAERSLVRATFDGVVARRLHNPGDLVEASASDPVLHVIDPHRLEVLASVPLADAPRITVGASGHITESSIKAADIQLRVVSTPAAVENGTATVPVRLRLTTPAIIPVGTPVRLDIDAEQHKGVVLIPAVAVVREAEETSVFIANEGKAHRRPVELGLVADSHVEIVSGVKAGERVIVDGQAGLPDNAAITETQEGTEK
jgi:RND family efflux transporter MFP subunit